MSAKREMIKEELKGTWGKLLHPKTVSLDDKVSEFICWYKTNIVKDMLGTETGKYYLPLHMRNFIEKMATWYELRYPDYEINKFIPGVDIQDKNLNDIMFRDSTDDNLDWASFFNYSKFKETLSGFEQMFLKKPKYQEIVCWNFGKSPAYLKLTSDGCIGEVHYMDDVLEALKQELVGRHLKDVIVMIKDRGIKLPKNNEFLKAIDDYERKVYQRSELLNCVMYRLIERGENRIGARRALLFAKEFGCNMDIPMKYGVDLRDPGLKHMIAFYLGAGGFWDLECYINYGLRTSKYETLSTIKISEILRMEEHFIPLDNDMSISADSESRENKGAVRKKKR